MITDEILLISERAMGPQRLQSTNVVVVVVFVFVGFVAVLDVL